jgi:periplasmic protein TonB
VTLLHSSYALHFVTLKWKQVGPTCLIKLKNMLMETIMLRTTFGFIIAIGVTFGLFAMMSFMIHSDTKPITIKPRPPITILQAREPEDIPEKDYKLPDPPKEVEMPEITEPNDAPAENTQVKFTTIEFPGPTIGIGGIKGGPGMSTMNNSEATPVFTLAPEYPHKARLSGEEGWVELSFTINADGTVSEPTVINSKPKRLFDRAALKAIKRWKFKPKMVNGKAVSSSATRYRIDFNLDG